MMRQLANLLGIGRATQIDDSGELQLLQVTEGARGTGFADRIVDQVRRVSEFGFASVAPIDSEVLMLRRGGDRSQSIAIATSHRPSRPRNLQPGDVGVYDVRGAKIMLMADGLVIDCAGLPAVLRNASTVTVTAQTVLVEATNATVKASGKARVESSTLEVTGDVVGRADGVPVSLNQLHDAYAAHKHPGVRSGTELTGLTDHAA